MVDTLSRWVQALPIFVLLTVALIPAATLSAENTILGIYKVWVAQTYTQDDRNVCMMWSQPEKAEGSYTTRGDIYVFLSHRPGEQRRNEIRFEAGYNFKDASHVTVTIDKKVFTLDTDTSTAWLTRSADEQAMVAAMKAGRDMLVEGTSSRDTATADTYSLHGFSAAYKAIDKACG
jgi:hypothetical protein